MLNYVGFPIKVFVPFKWSRLDQQHYVLCTWWKTKPIPLLCDAHFEELSNPGKCPGGKIVFCQRVKYISTIGDILIQGYLMLMDALQNLLFTQRKICNGNQEIYCNINHHVFRRSKVHGCDGRKLTSKDNKNLQSLHNLVRTDQPKKLLNNSFVESRTIAPPCVAIGDERIILQWHLLVVRAD